jgi:hypothetical protein
MMNDAPDDTVITFERKSRFRRERFNSITASTKPWRVKNAWPMKGVVFVVGASGAAKTFFVLDGLLRLTSGVEKLWGRKAKQCGVVMFAAEDAEGCRIRVLGWKRAKQRVSDMPFEMVDHPVDLTDEAAVDELKAELRLAADQMEAEGVPLGIVAFDTLSCCIAGADENSGVDMARVLATLQAIAKDLGVLVVVVAHFGKVGATGGIRGWSGLTANADGVIEIERDPDEPDLRRVRFKKVKNGRDGGEMSFRLEEAEIGLEDADGEQITTCTIKFEQAASVAKRKRRKVLNAAQTVTLKAIKFVTDHGATFVPPVTAEGVKNWTKAVSKDDVKARAITSGLSQEGEARNTINVRFNRALEAVCAAEYARVDGDFVWLI